MYVTWISYFTDNYGFIHHVLRGRHSKIVFLQTKVLRDTSMLSTYNYIKYSIHFMGLSTIPNPSTIESSIDYCSLRSLFPHIRTVIPVQVIADFKKMRLLTGDTGLVVKAIRNSSLLEVR